MTLVNKLNSPITIPPPPGFKPFPNEAVAGSLLFRFEQMADTHADAIAVRDQETKLTYRELNISANRLAHTILAKAGTENRTVAFFAHQNVESIINLLAIQKAGKTYIALNPSFPVERTESLLRTVKATHLVSASRDTQLEKKLRKKVPGLKGISSTETEARSDNPNVLIDLELPPYLSYTSGTTGEPKIITLENRGLLCQVRDYTNDFGFNSGDKFALFNPLSFGGGSFNLLGSLMNGATLHIYDIKNQGLQDIPAWINREAISVLNMPPPVFRNIFSSLAPDAILPSVRIIILAGDTMIHREIEIARQHFSRSCYLVNMFAMTEAGLVSRYIMDFNTEPGNIVPVGYPFAGVEISIVNEQGEELPQGQEGIIQVKTEYISRDPRMNSTKGSDGLFHPDPSSRRCVAKFEDLGRFREDGALEHLGRKDNVVKIHGLRIDLAEVESLLFTLPSVKDATLITLRDKRVHGLQIVAYIVVQPGEKLTIPDIYKFLSWKLPQYMMPTRFVFIERLPLSANGKVDKGQLPEPDWDEPAPGQKYEKPRSPVELQLVEIWQELLGLKRVGIHDNFFALGGNSLLALQMFARVETKMHVKLPLQSLLTNPTLAEIGSLIEKNVGTHTPVTIAPLRKGNDDPAIFMIPGGARTGISLVDLTDRLKPGPSIYALEYPGMDGHLEPQDDIRDLASFFIQEIKSVQSNGPYHLVGPCLGGVIAFEMAQQLLVDGKQVGLLALLDSSPPTEDMAKPRQYYRNRAASLVKRRELGNYLQGLKGQLRRKLRTIISVKGPLGESRLYIYLRTVWDRIRYTFHKTGHQNWLDHRLDRQTWAVFEKLQVAKKRYIPGKYPGKALVILNQLANGTMREDLWSELLGAEDCYYIPGTNHRNIFSLESSLDRMAELIDGYFSSINVSINNVSIKKGTKDDSI